MLQNKYMIAGAFCISTLIQGAASSSSSSGQVAHPDSPGERLQFKDCFIRKTVSMPGAKRFYENITTAHPSTGRDKLIFCVGTVASPDEQMTQAMSTKIATFLSTSLGRKPILEEADEVDRNMAACIRDITPDFPALIAVQEDFRKSRSERRRLPGGVELHFCWYQSVDDPQHPEVEDPILKRGRYVLADHPLKFVVQYTFDNTLSKDVQCERRMEEGGRELQKFAQRGVILPTELMTVIKPDPSIAPQDRSSTVFNQKDLSVAAALLALRQKTQTLCEGAESVHEVPILEFQPEIYAQYLEQASADLKKPSDNKCVIH